MQAEEHYTVYNYQAISARLTAEIAMWRPIETIRSWFEERSRWSNLRAIGESGLVKASVLMPAFGYLLLLNENVHQFLLLKYDGVLLHFLHLPPLWRVWLLFYGTFFLALGSILFSVCCPREIKRYGSAYDMATAERTHIAQQHQGQKARSALRNLYVGISKWEQKLFPRLDFDHPTFNLPTSDAESQIAIFQWRALDLRWPWRRIAVFILFRAGLFLIAVPAIVTFLQVTSVLARRL
jgi:hypothetical protein